MFLRMHYYNNKKNYNSGCYIPCLWYSHRMNLSPPSRPSPVKGRDSGWRRTKIKTVGASCSAARLVCSITIISIINILLKQSFYLFMYRISLSVAPFLFNTHTHTPLYLYLWHGMPLQMKSASPWHYIKTCTCALYFVLCTLEWTVKYPCAKWYCPHDQI